jgi:ATP-dependent protease HslVU (ClpYQ) peptidase subunit
MTVIVSVKINDGVIMAADSASTFGTGQNLPKRRQAREAG